MSGLFDNNGNLNTSKSTKSSSNKKLMVNTSGGLFDDNGNMKGVQASKPAPSVTPKLVPKKIAKAPTKKSNAILDILSNVKDNLVNGAKSMAGGAVDFAKETVNDIVDTGKDATDTILHPSHYIHNTVKGLKGAKDDLETAGLNVLDSATLGLGTKGLDKLTNNKASAEKARLQKVNPGLSAMSQLAGYTVPYGGAEKALGKVIKGGSVASKILKGATVGGLVGGGENALRSVENGKKVNPTDVITNGLTMGALGAAGGLFSKLKDDKTTTTDNTEINGLANDTQTPRIVSGTKADKTTIGQKLNKLYTSTIDKNKSISDFSKLGKDKTYTLATNSANQKNIADYILKDNLVDRRGNVIGDSFAKVIKDIPKGQENDFMMYALEKHNIARAAEGKPVLPNHNSAQSSAIVKDIEARYPEWKTKSENITGWINNFMNEWGVNAGTLNKDLHEANTKTYPNYIPTNRDFSTLEQGGESYGGGNKGFVNQTTPIKRATGSSRDIIDPRENIANLVVRTVKSAKNNEVGQSLVNTIRSNPEKMNKFAEIVDEPKGNVSNVVRVLENGNPTYVKINDLGLLKAMEDLNKTDVGNIEAKAKTVTNAFKSLVTQKNPIFAVRNIARDVPTAYVNGSEHNPFKFGANLLGAGKDIVTNSPNYQKYKALGGGGSNFFDASNPTKSINELVGNQNIVKKALKFVPDKIEKFNNITEAAPRLAEFNSVLKKTSDIDKAMYAANDITTNFSRGGDVIKHADSFVPYLNAGIQGLDKEVRQLKNHPIGTLAKGAAAITAPTLIVNHINKNNPNYQALDNRTKDSYFLFPNEAGEHDKNGHATTFIKIPKSRELGVLFGSLAERTQRALSGDDKAFKGFRNTVATNFSPSNPVENNIVAPLTYNLATNKDFAGRAIVPRSMKDQNLSPQYQYDDTTSELAKALGKVKIPAIGNLSPKQIDYIVKSYTGVLGQLGLPATTKSTYTGQGGANILKPIASQFTANPLYSNQAATDFYDNIDKLKQKAADSNFVNKIPSKTLTIQEAIRNAVNKQQQYVSALNKAIKNETDPAKIKLYRQAILNIESRTNKVMDLPKLKNLSNK